MDSQKQPQFKYTSGVDYCSSGAVPKLGEPLRFQRCTRWAFEFLEFNPNFMGRDFVARQVLFELNSRAGADPRA
jgi:hypothetical protein